MTKEVRLMVLMLECHTCIEAVRRALKDLPSVQIAQAELAKRFLRVQFDEALVSFERIRRALHAIGFTPA